MDSAAGTTKQARDRTFQEVYAMKGVPMNTYGMKYFDILKNAELRGLATAAGCDMGPKHDVSKCRHKRYIIMTDADIDGNKITSLLAVFFLCHMRGIVENGMLYKMAPPLYKTTGAGSRYIDNMKELNQLIQREISKNLDIKSLSTKKMLKEKDIRIILENNKNYLRELTKLSNKYAIDPIVIEFVLMHHDKTYPAIAKLLNKQFKFITATAKKDKLMIEGVFNKEFQYAVVDTKLAKKAKEVEKFIAINKKLYGMEFEVNKEKMSLYQMLNKFKNYTPKMTRFKGLGEMNSKDLWETSLNPENRHLIRLTVEDLEKDVERFALLHSTKKKDVEARAKLFEAFKIDIDDIDN